MGFWLFFKHLKALAQVQHWGEVIQQLRGDIKEASAQVGDIGFGWFSGAVWIWLKSIIEEMLSISFEVREANEQVGDMDFGLGFKHCEALAVSPT